MDMMCEALGLGGIAAFLWLRQKNLFWAILAGHAGVAAAGLAHPMALGAAAGLIALTLYYDRRRIRIAHMALAAVPYLVGALAWGAAVVDLARLANVNVLRQHNLERTVLGNRLGPFPFGGNSARLGAAWGFLRSGAVTVLSIEDVDLPDLEALMNRYADRPMDFADATLVHLARREHLNTVFTVDHDDFETYRIDGRKRFRVVPGR